MQRTLFRHIGSTVAILAAAAAGLTAIASPVNAAAPVLTPSATTVGLGGTVLVSASGCVSPPEPPDSDENSYRFAEISLITQTPDGEILASGFNSSNEGSEAALTVPGWVDPADPAVLTGVCRQYSEGPDGFSESVAFTYPDVPIDITTGSASAPNPAFTLNRTTAAGGQSLLLTGSGCSVGDVGSGAVFEGSDRSGRTRLVFVAGAETEVSAPTFQVEIPLLNEGNFDEGPGVGVGPLPEGPYTVIMACVSGGDEESFRVDLAKGQNIEVVGSFPSDQISLTQADDDSLLLEGRGCTGGQTVSATFAGYAYGDLEQFLGASPPGGRNGAAGPFRRALPIPDGEFEQTVEATPDGAGDWSITWTPPESGYEMQVTTACGIATADGFRYVSQVWYESFWADLYIDRVSPATAPTGEQVTIHAEGDCNGAGSTLILDRNRAVVSEGPLVGPNDYGMFTGTVTAPATPGTYFLSVGCDDKRGYPKQFEVFAPNPVAETGPLAAGPKTGWPSEGGRTMYEGRIGPITLPAQDMEMGVGAKAMGPSGLFIDVPRPEGDFAITKLSFDLVDAEGMPVDQTAAHLHHFVITNKSSKNPACPNSTFGLPGEIVGAAGAERTVLDFGPGPYAIPVEAADAWTGVYSVMNMNGTDQTVFLTYDIEYRRDVKNVRPVTTYFGSATGCSTFNWTIDGSGVPDKQSTYVTITKPGRVIGTGGHIHNGGLYSALTDDRGRELCRSTIEYGTGTIGHDHGGSPANANDVTATTVVGEPMEPGYPPEFYEDDPPIAGLTGCALAEQVKAGQRLRFDAVYDNLKPRSGVMGIFTMYVWEGGGPADPVVAPIDTAAPPATAIAGDPNYAG